MAEKTKKRRFLKIVLLIIVTPLLVVTLYSGYLFLTLPDVTYLKTENPKTSALMEQRISEAKEKKEKLAVRYKWTPFERIPQLLKDAVRISEDVAFYDHEGVDFYELKESLKRNLEKGSVVRGGSTITQQLAKNLFLNTKRSYFRKLEEYFIARSLEKHLNKNRIFCLYLNIIEFGRGIFGVQAASIYFFKKPADRLNLEEIIRLTAVIPKPLKVSPNSDSRYIKWRANLLLERMYHYKRINQEQYNLLKQRFK